MIYFTRHCFSFRKDDNICRICCGYFWSRMAIRQLWKKDSHNSTVTITFWCRNSCIDDDCVHCFPNLMVLNRSVSSFTNLFQSTKDYQNDKNFIVTLYDYLLPGIAAIGVFTVCFVWAMESVSGKWKTIIGVTMAFSWPISRLVKY